MTRLGLLLVGLAVASATLLAQTTSPSFEVASIKPTRIDRPQESAEDLRGWRSPGVVTNSAFPVVSQNK